MIKLTKVLTLFVILGCSEQPDVEGLWELQKSDVDMIPQGFQPTYVKFEKDGAFSASKQNRDIVGLYSINKDLLSLVSDDKTWFNRTWKVFTSEEELVLNDVRNGFRGEQLRFKKIEKFPDFGEFQQALNGTWELYKTEEKGITRIINNTHFQINENEYSIVKNRVQVETGKVLIDDRHRKMIFENTKITWSVRFVLNELRLENKSLEITHRLRKSE